MLVGLFIYRVLPGIGLPSLLSEGFYLLILLRAIQVSFGLFFLVLNWSG